MILSHRFLRGLLTFGLCVAVTACTTSPSVVTPPPSTPTPSTKIANTNGYDPARNPQDDLKAALAAAQAENKRILMEVGGEWCIWCHQMDQFFEQHAALKQLRDENFIVVKVNFSTENENTAFLSQYPAIPGYPHLFVLDSDGKLLQSQDTSQLEEGSSYNLEKFMTFLQTWAKS